MAYLYLEGKSKIIRELRKKLETMESTIRELNEKMRERDKALEKNKKLLEERNEEILKLRSRLVEIESLYKASEEEINRLKSELNKINLKYEESQRELSELKLKYTIKENALKELERLQSSTSMPKFGGTIEVFCPECKSYHTIPYIPGKYYLCWPKWVIVYKDGTIRTGPEPWEP